MKAYLSLLILLTLSGCGNQLEENENSDQAKAPATTSTEKRKLSQEFKDYWYRGEAEISSYQLSQARYGELREGQAVLIFVTEPFREGKQVKADNSHPDNIPVLKLNSTRKFLTGIYPYSIMSSTFSPVYEKDHALKITNSVQEWCGQVFAQLNKRNSYEVETFSYFESEGDQEITIPITWLENELWNLIRLAPGELPVGEIEVVPAFEYLRLAHKDFKAYPAKGRKTEDGELITYTLEYPGLNRTLSIRFQTKAPHRIEGWEEIYKSGFGTDARKMRSSAERITTIKTPYWRQNSNKDTYLRDSLGINNL